MTRKQTLPLLTLIFTVAATNATNATNAGATQITPPRMFKESAQPQTTNEQAQASANQAPADKSRSDDNEMVTLEMIEKMVQEDLARERAEKERKARGEKEKEAPVQKSEKTKKSETVQADADGGIRLEPRRSEDAPKTAIENFNDLIKGGIANTRAFLKQYMTGLDKNITEQVKGFSSAKLIRDLNYPSWQWLIFIYNRQFAMNELKARLQAGDQKTIAAFVADFLEKIEKFSMQNSDPLYNQPDLEALLIDVFEKVQTLEVESLKDVQFSLRFYNTVSKNQAKLQLAWNSQPQLVELMNNYIKTFKIVINWQPDWSAETIADLLISKSRIGQADEIDGDIILLLNMLSDTKVMNIIRYTSLQNEKFRQRITEAAIVYPNLTDQIVRYSMKRIKAFDASRSGTRHALNPYLFDLQIVTDHASKDDVEALADHILQILAALEKVNQKAAEKLAAKMASNKKFSGKGFSGSGGGSSGGAGRGGNGGGNGAGSGGIGSIALRGVSNSYLAGSGNAAAMVRILREQILAENLRNLVKQLGEKLGQICQKAARDGDKELLETCIGPVWQQMLVYRKDVVKRYYHRGSRGARDVRKQRALRGSLELINSIHQKMLPLVVLHSPEKTGYTCQKVKPQSKLKAAITKAGQQIAGTRLATNLKSTSVMTGVTSDYTLDVRIIGQCKSQHGEESATGDFWAKQNADVYRIEKQQTVVEPVMRNFGERFYGISPTRAGHWFIEPRMSCVPAPGVSKEAIEGNEQAEAFYPQNCSVQLDICMDRINAGLNKANRQEWQKTRTGNVYYNNMLNLLEAPLAIAHASTPLALNEKPSEQLIELENQFRLLGKFQCLVKSFLNNEYTVEYHGNSGNGAYGNLRVPNQPRGYLTKHTLYEIMNAGARPGSGQSEALKKFCKVNSMADEIAFFKQDDTVDRSPVAWQFDGTETVKGCDSAIQRGYLIRPSEI